MVTHDVRRANEGRRHRLRRGGGLGRSAKRDAATLKPNSWRYGGFRSYGSTRWAPRFYHPYFSICSGFSNHPAIGMLSFDGNPDLNQNSCMCKLYSHPCMAKTSRRTGNRTWSYMDFQFIFFRPCDQNPVFSQCSKIRFSWLHCELQCVLWKGGKYHAKWQVSIPNCCKYKANGIRKEIRKKKPDQEKIVNLFFTPLVVSE